MNAQSLVCERGMRRFVAFCGSPPTAPGSRARKKDYCLWQSEPQPSSELAERLVLGHYEAEHPELFSKVSAGAMNGRLVAGPRDPLVSRIDLDADPVDLRWREDGED